MGNKRGLEQHKEIDLGFSGSGWLHWIYYTNMRKSTKNTLKEWDDPNGERDIKRAEEKERKRFRLRVEKSKANHSNSKKRNTLYFHLKRFLPFLFIVELFILCISFSIARSPSTLLWTNDIPYPFAVSDLVVLTGQDHYMYTFGGINESYDVVSNSYRFNTTAGFPREWIPIASMPNGVGGATGCVANDGRFFIFGGSDSDQDVSNVIQIYNTTDNSWNTTNPILPKGASIEDYYMSCAVDSNSGLMYITGGYYNGTRFYSYNISSNTVTNLSSSSSSPTPFNLNGQGSFVINSKLYVFGGEDSITRNFSAITHIYDIANNSWSIGNNMTQAESWFGYATDGNLFFAIGGTSSTMFVEYFQYIQVYNITSGNWSINYGIVYTGGIEGNTATFLDGSLYSIGGYDGGYIYSPENKFASLCGIYLFSGGCDDQNQCTFNDTCKSGICTGINITCPPKQCQNSTCNPSTGCIYTNLSGIACNDNNQCTTRDTCKSGICTGINITCPSPKQCKNSTCNPSTGCVFENLTNGTQCNSSNKCLLNSTCSNGECTGQSKICSNSICDTSTGQCISNNSTISSKTTGISSGGIAGIVITLLIFIVIVSVVGYLFWTFERNRRTSNALRSESYPPYGSRFGNINTVNESSIYSITPNPVVQSNSSFIIPADNTSPILQMSKMEIKRKIGEGAFGCVYLGILNRTEVAIKQLSKTNASEEDIKEFMAEAELMRNLPAHPNVVMFRGVTVPPDPLSIVTDYCNGGSLIEYLKRNPNLPISQKIQFIKDIAKGMLHLHCGSPGKEVIHRDLAARNILLKNGVAVITDFGLSRVKSSVDDYQKTQNNVGPLKWMSPESLFQNKYSTKSDVFSFGVVIYEIITQEPPWKDLNAVQAVGELRDGHRMALPENCICPTAMKELMEKCWAQLPTDRPDFEKICEILDRMDENESIPSNLK